MKVLIIDDSAFVLRRHTELTTEAGAEAVSAKGGEQGIEMYEKVLPDIVLCDIMMPDMDGYEVLEILKEITPDIRLYFVSAEMSEKIQKKVEELGAQGILQKPLELETLESIFSIEKKQIS